MEMQRAPSPRALIVQLDLKIDAIRTGLKSEVKIDPLSAVSWQRAWNKYPELRERERDLFRQRGEAQIDRNLLDAKVGARNSRPARKSKCHHCGSVMFAPAALPPVEKG